MKKALLTFGLVLFSTSVAFAGGPGRHKNFHRPPAIHHAQPHHRPAPRIHHKHNHKNFVLGGLAIGIGSALISNILWQNTTPTTTIIPAPIVPQPATSTTTTTTTVVTTSSEPVANSTCRTKYIAPRQWVWECIP